MQKLWLKDFDKHIAPAMAEAAWQLHNAGKVRALREVEKHFWVGKVQVEAMLAYEVETIITPHKIHQFTCECWQEGRRMMCVHVAAVLLEVRAFLERKALEKIKKEEKKDDAVAGRFTVSTVLADIEPARLVEFVREYARRDKDFSLALKTWFAAGEDDSEQHFLQLLESVLPKNLGSKTFPDKDFRRLLHVLGELEKQLGASAEMGNQFAVFNLSVAILLKINPLLEAVGENRRDALLEFSEKAWLTIQKIDLQLASPELRERHWKFVFAAIENLTFPKELQRPLIGFLAAQTTKFDAIHDLFDRTPQPVPPPILTLYLAALGRRGMEKAGIRVLEDFSKSAEDIRECLVELYYLDCHAAMILLAEHFLEKQIFHAGHRRELEDLLLLAAEKSQDKKRMLQLYKIRFARNGSFEMLKKMKETAGAKWEKEFQNLILDLKKTGDAQKVAAVLANSGDVDALASFLFSEKNLHLLQKYESKLLPDRRDELQNQYENLMSEYLSEHFGRPANLLLREILNELILKNEQRMAVDLIRVLVQKFPERQSLKEDLGEVFPKHRRRQILGF